MPNIRSALLTVRYKDQHLQRLKELLAPAEIVHIEPNDAAGIEKALKTVDVAILAGDLDERFVGAPNLKWVHCDHAGLNKSARPKVLESGLVVTGSVGRAAHALAQHIFYFALALTYDAAGHEEQKKQHLWRGIVDLGSRRSLIDKTIGIIGLGATGLETARIAKAFGMKTLGYRKSDVPSMPNVDRLYGAERGDTIEPLLRESDFVVLSIRLTDATWHMIGEQQLKQMKPSAYLINMARGSVVDEPALIAALKAGTIAGAGLDVFEEEPLPKGAPIWDAPNLMITPHATAEVPDLQANSLAIIADNIARYREGREMRNQLRADDVYTH